jgi:hypothetical protein
MIVFGISHAVLYLFDRFVFKRLEFIGGPVIAGDVSIRRRMWDGFRQVKTGFFFMMTLVYFRSGSVQQASEVFGMLWNPGYINCTLFGAGAEFLLVPNHIWLFLVLFLILDLWIVKVRVDVWLAKFGWAWRWLFYAFALVSIWVFGGAVNHPFVYFQF